MSFVDRQSVAPLLETLQAAAFCSAVPFHTPGHKKGQGVLPSLRTWLGKAVLQADLPELPELDNLFAPEGVILAAQTLAAEVFGAEKTWFLANGSTCGIEAAVLATCNPGDKLLLPRNAHRSAISALVLTGAIPIFMQPDYDPEWQIAHGVSADAVYACLQQHPDAKAVLIVSPTYYGVCSDVASIAQVTHQFQIPLLVDEAHGAHFGFHPDLPPSALATGADLVVQSTHKTLSAFTQAAMLHVQGNRIDRHRLDRALQLVQSTSPNYLLLASLDAARQQMALEGKALMQATLQLADQARQQIAQIPGLGVFQPEHIQSRSGSFTLDRTRLTVDVTNLGLTGFQADEILHEQLGITAELPGLQHLTFIISLGNTIADIDRLVQAFQILADQHRQDAVTQNPIKQPDRPIHPVESNVLSATTDKAIYPKSPIQNPKPEIQNLLSPRAAFFSSWETVPMATAIDQISAEVVCPYPPGIPLLFPGERITAEAVQQLEAILQAGGQVTGGVDPQLKTLKIIKSGNRN